MLDIILAAVYSLISLATLITTVLGHGALFVVLHSSVIDGRNTHLQRINTLFLGPTSHGMS